MEKARIEFIKVWRILHSYEAQEEFALMRAQIEYEQERELKSTGEIFRLSKHRAMASIAVQTMTSLTGVNVIQYYQTILYKSLGIPQTTILALAGVYGTIAFASNFVTTRFLTDQWGRRKMILTGLTGSSSLKSSLLSCSVSSKILTTMSERGSRSREYIYSL